MKTLDYIIISQNYIAQDKILLDDFSPVLLCCFLNLKYGWDNDGRGAKGSLVSLSIWLPDRVELFVFRSKSRPVAFMYKNLSPGWIGRTAELLWKRPELHP